MLNMALKMEKKSTDTCKSQKEAKRRHRQRINAHLSTIHSLLPNAAKLDKALLLVEVVQCAKELRKQPDDIAHHHNRDFSCNSSSSETGLDHFEFNTWQFQRESDEATISDYCDGVGELKLMKATLCCENQHNLWVRRGCWSIGTGLMLLLLENEKALPASMDYLF